MVNASTPLWLRGFGTLLILLASALALQMERREGNGAAAVRPVDPLPAAAPAPVPTAEQAQVAALADEVRALRLSLQDNELSDRVFENSAFQLLGLLGTLLIATSFFVEAWLKRRDPPLAAGPAP